MPTTLVNQINDGLLDRLHDGQLVYTENDVELASQRVNAHDNQLIKGSVDRLLHQQAHRIAVKDNFRADYTYTIKGNVIAIIDLDQGNRSVTNDIENVLGDIKRKLHRDLSGYAVVYRDSMGNWDGVRLDDTGRVEFYALRETEQQKAVVRLLHPLP